MEDIGFVYYWWLKDYQQAAEWFKRAGEQPGAPAWLAPLAATTLARGRRSPIVALAVDAAAAEHRRRMAPRNARIRLQQLDAMDAIDELNRRVERFIAREQPAAARLA